MEKYNEVNKRGYNKLAPYFDEEKRLTTANFHEVTLEFFRNAISKYVRKEMKVLEIGPGKDWLTKNVRFPDVDYYKVDVAEKMINNQEKSISASADDMPFEDNTFDCVISSLGDPYFYKEALIEVCRVLKKDGKMILSTPSNEWAEGIRGKKGKSIFVENGKTIETFSFTYDIEEMKELWVECGFIPMSIQEEFASKIEGIVSKDIEKSANNKNKATETLSIAISAIFRKA